MILLIGGLKLHQTRQKQQQSRKNSDMLQQPQTKPPADLSRFLLLLLHENYNDLIFKGTVCETGVRIRFVWVITVSDSHRGVLK